jgi:hypothetical protein
VCRRSCQRKPVMPARFRALRQAFVFTHLIGGPRPLAHQRLSTRELD